MATMYAWSNFPVKFNEHGQVEETIKTGDQITKEMLGISQEDWDDLVARGIVREEEYPDLPSYVSPAEYVAQLEYQPTPVEEAELNTTLHGVIESSSPVQAVEEQVAPPVEITVESDDE